MPSAQILEQARQAGLDFALHHHAEDDNIREIRDCLRRAHGDVTKALTFLAEDGVGNYLGCGGRCGPAHHGKPSYRVECYGPAHSHPINIWIGDNHWDREPDLIMSWRTVFEYVAAMDQLRLPGF